MSEPEEEYTFSLQPEDISADKANVNYLILLQMNRVNSLFASKRSVTGTEASAIANGISSGLLAIESMMINILTQEYFDAVKPIKSKLELPVEFDKKVAMGKIDFNEKDLPQMIQSHRFLADQAPSYAIKELGEWYAQLVRALPKTGLIQTPSMVHEFKK